MAGQRVLGAVVAVALILALPSVARAATVADPDPLTVDSYQENFGVDEETAEENLETQALGSSIVGQLQATLGDGYAGVWFDNEAGEFVVPVLGVVDRAKAAALLGRIGLAGRYRFAAADSSWSELLSAHEELDASLSEQLKAGHVRTFVDPVANTVVVERAEGLSAAAKTAIAGKADAAPVEVEVQQADRGSLFGSLTACHFEPNPKGCDLPARGGVPISFESAGTSTFCTAGFPAVRSADGHKFMLTAGHCLQGLGSVMWRTLDSVGTAHDVGKMDSWAFNGAGGYNDYGTIDVEGQWWASGAWKYQVVNWGVSQEYSINSESWSYVGEQACIVSGNWGKKCAPVTEVDVTYTDPKPTRIDHTNVFGPLCVEHGDSGSPIFNDGSHSALGLLSADNSWGGVPGVCERYGYYTEITRDTDGLGIKVAPVREGGAPTATTGGPSNLQPFQATVGGSVNPNQVQTSFQFEYGLDTSYGGFAPPSPGEAGHGGGSTPVSATISGLYPGTVYHYRLRAKSAAGISYGSDATFKTPLPPPVARTGTAKEGTETGARLTGTVEQLYGETPTTYWFKYGHTTAYGSESSHQVVVANPSAKPVSTVLTGLEAGTTYHYRLVASNEWGTTEGVDEAFTAGWDIQSPPSEGFSQTFRIEGVSCGSPTMCVAVGSENGYVRVKTWNRIKWSYSPAQNPAGAQEVVLRDVSCPSASFCMAVGYYKASTGEIKTLAEKYNGSSWEVLSPPNRGGSTAANYFNGVSCFNATSCEVVGYYFPAVGTSKANGEYWNGSGWSSEVQLVAEESSNGGAYLKDVSCVAEKECYGVGYFLNKNAEWKQLVGTWYGGGWSVTVNPEAPAGSTGAWLEDVSCSASFYCAQAGFYDDGTGVRRPLIKSAAGGGFGIQSVVIPEGAVRTELFGVSCPTPSSCMAIGEYRVPGRAVRGIGYSYEGSGWVDHYPLNPADQAEGDGTLVLQSVSCPRAGLCLGAGSYMSITGVAPLAVTFQKAVPPTVTTGSATGTTDSGSTLRAKINANGQKTSYFFEYGKTTAYGSSTPMVEAGEAETSAEFTQAISGLESGTLYHFRIVASSAPGTVVGTDATFTTLRKWRLQTAPNPSETKPVKFLAASCPTTTVCFAGGEYEPSAGTPVAFVERWSGGSWATQTFPVTMTAIDGLSCPSASECIAAGYVLNPTTKVKTVLTARWNGTSWALQTVPPVPSGAKESAFRDVSCQTNGLCTAVGYYVSSTGLHLPLADRWNGSAWTLQTPLVPAGTSLSELTAVSCRNWMLIGVPGTECAAVGFAEKAGVKEPLAERWPNTSWEIKAIGMPAGAKGAQMTSIACPPPSGFQLQCTATGLYTPSSGTSSGYIERWNASAWSLSNTLSGGAELNGISCVSETNCETVGSFLKAGVPAPLAQQWNGSSWASQLPPTPEGAKAAVLNGISCDTAGNCGAVGSYENASGLKRALADRFS
ncbi:MAG: S1 family peptidase [Solirubrobacterales bacterium]